MADGVHVRFTADVSDFISALDSVSSKTAQSSKFQQEHGNEIEKVAKAYGDLRASLDPTVASAANFQRATDLTNAALQTGLINQQQYAEQIEKLNEAFNSSAEGAKKSGAAHEEFSLATAGARREVIVLGHEVVTGNFARIPGSLIVMAERAGGVSLGALGMAGAFAAVGVVLGEVLIKQERWSETLARSQALLENSGRASQFNTQMLSNYASQIERLPGVTQAGAQQILIALSGIGSATPQIFEKIFASLTGFTLLTGEKAPEAAATLAKAIENPSRAIEELAAKHVQLDAETIRLINTQQRAGEIFAAQNTLVDGLANVTAKAAEHLTEFEKETNQAGVALLDIGAAFSGTSDKSTILASAMRIVVSVLQGLIVPAAIAGKAFSDLGDFVLIVVRAIQGSIDTIATFSDVTAAGLNGVIRATVAAARGDPSGAADILKGVPASVADAWNGAADKVKADVAGIRDATSDVFKPFTPGVPQKPAAPVAGGGDQEGESKSEQAIRLNEILDRTLTSRRDLAKIGDDESRIQQRLNELLDESTTATAARRAQIGNEVNELTEALKIEQQRREAIENRDKPKGQASQVDTWRTELAERKAGEDQFHQLSAADEAAYWKTKIALTADGSKEREAVEREYYAALARARGQDIADNLDNLKQQITHEGATVDQRVALLAQYHNAYTASLTAGTAAFRAAKEFELAETKRIEDEKMKAAEKGIDDQVKAIERQGAQVQRALDTQAKIKGTTDEQALQQTIANLDREYQAEQDLLNKELGLSGISLADKQRINGQLEALDDRYNNAVLQAAIKTVDAQSKAWDQVIGPVNRAFEQSATGVITGTQTAQQAIARFGQSIVASFVSDGVSIATNWLKTQLLMTTETAAQTRARQLLSTLSTTTDAATIRQAIQTFTAGETAKTAASATGSAERGSIGNTENVGFFARIGEQVARWLGLETDKTAETEAGSITRAATTAAVDIPSAFGQIQVAASVAAANAFAATAAIPLIGPELAPAAAAAAYGETLGWAAGLGGGFSARGGWGQVPYDGAVTELHKDEMVLPASIASPLRGILSGFTLPNMSGGSGSITPKTASAGSASASGPTQLSATFTGPITSADPQALAHTVLSTMDSAARNGVPNKYSHLKRALKK